MHAVITILDNITETSMPFNEFVLYRANHYKHEKHFLLICGSKKELPEVAIPSDLMIKYVGCNIFQLRKELKSIIGELNDQNIPYCIHLHQVKSGVLSELAITGMRLRKKVIFNVHSTFSGYKMHNKILSFLNAFLANRIVCVSNTSFDDYPKIIKVIKGKRICAIQNGVDTERIDNCFTTDIKTSHNNCNFIYVARFVPVKNHVFLVQALKKCKENVQFIFIGEEDSERLIRQKAIELGVESRITFTGLIPRNEVFQRLQAADFYISSSTLEGLPVSVLEAMYCGLPCILSDIPQHRELAGEEVVILPLVVDKWVREIDRLTTMSNKQRDEIGTKIKNKVKESFSLKAMHRKYDMIYYKQCNGGK